MCRVVAERDRRVAGAGRRDDEARERQQRVKHHDDRTVPALQLRRLRSGSRRHYSGGHPKRSNDERRYVHWHAQLSALMVLRFSADAVTA
jgi:hypothetical protein